MCACAHMHLSVCISIHGHAFMCQDVCVCTHVLKLGVDTKCFPLLLSTVFFETRSLLKPGAQQFG